MKNVQNQYIHFYIVQKSILYCTFTKLSKTFKSNEWHNVFFCFCCTKIILDNTNICFDNFFVIFWLFWKSSQLCKSHLYNTKKLYKLIHLLCRRIILYNFSVLYKWFFFFFKYTNICTIVSVQFRLNYVIFKNIEMVYIILF